ncbi:peptide chain release factor 3 [Ferrimicrobium acidiphilum]|jgi:peptide chain release factor 3|uniref:Peptide chain release factor 3 n=1 Tax=Ferrimicrobium acidiphilum DSM 19497 TaxID=1121877 RepID=A0A0D8FVX0_9ACTN|nr:peptide chain release factor 3 [Ferrimicrobium acidiphilum]KJE77443.1 peptide chain release factor 3 [Ferrimicrobium acidiphilum DSM 19497]MCL5052649.1 peptide chain release factor 3 [Gammaproteobacteria bacterium]
MLTEEVESGEILKEAARRRTFAIISHPDAGKTTLTEKFLLYAGAIAEAGAVKARTGRRDTRSDWMAMEQERGISVTSTALQFEYRDCVINLLDTPGHRDFSEDTYRVLTAVDAVVMVLDVAKGVEAQTLKLFEVCRSLGLPMITFLNKLDRPGRSPLELLDEIEAKIGVRPTPVTWPVGIPGEFHGVIDRRTGGFTRFERSVRGKTLAPEVEVDASVAATEEGGDWTNAADECGLLDAVGASHDQESFLEGKTSPLFVGSAMNNFGVRSLLDAVVDLIPSPRPRRDVDGQTRSLDAPLSGFVFKIQANMDPAHRDHVAFVRVCSGRFVRGVSLTHAATGRTFSTKYASSLFGSDRSTVEVAFPGDVVGLVNAGELRIGDALYADSPVVFPSFPQFAPELFRRVRVKDPGRAKQFRRGLDQLEREGVLQVLYELDGDPLPVLAAVGQMQFEVFQYRMEHEFGALTEYLSTPYRVARVVTAEDAATLGRIPGVRLLRRGDGTLLLLFESAIRLQTVMRDHPEVDFGALLGSGFSSLT